MGPSGEILKVRIGRIRRPTDSPSMVSVNSGTHPNCGNTTLIHSPAPEVISPSLVNSTNNAVIGTNPYPQTTPAYSNTIIVDANIPINSTTVNPNAPSHGLTTYDWNVRYPGATPCPRPMHQR